MGHHVSALDCYTPYYARALKENNAQAVRRAGVAMQEIDLVEDDLIQALDGVDLVYHLAAQPGISATTPFETYLRNNIIATQRLLEAVESQPQPAYVVNISTSSVYGLDATDAEDAAPEACIALWRHQAGGRAARAGRCARRTSCGLLDASSFPCTARESVQKNYTLN